MILSLIILAEQSLKAKISFELAKHYPNNPYMYCEKSFFKSESEYNKFSAEFKNNINREKDVPFVNHHIKKYNNIFQIWVAIELMTLGNMKYLY